MKKSILAALGVVLLLVLGVIWLMAGANPDNLERTEVTVDLPDTFEK